MQCDKTGERLTSVQGLLELKRGLTVEQMPVMFSIERVGRLLIATNIPSCQRYEETGTFMVIFNWRKLYIQIGILSDDIVCF